MSEDKKHYVVYYYESLRDGYEEGAKIVTGLDNALALAEKWGGGSNRSAFSVKIFELGIEVPLISECIEEKTEVVKKSTKIRLARGK